MKRKLLKKVREQFPDIPKNAEIVRNTPTMKEREKGALLWHVKDHGVGSAFTMKDCVECRSWQIVEKKEHSEVYPLD